MSDLLSPDKLNLFLFFVVPGFVSLKTYDLMVPSARRDLSQSIIEVVSFSMVNLAIWYWLVDLLSAHNVRTNQPALFYIAMFVVLLISPALLAFGVVSLLRSRRLRGKFLHPTPMPWDYVFGKGSSYWLLFHLKSGQKVGGYYSQHSFASSFPRPQEIYVEHLWRVSPEGLFLEKIDRTAGAIVRADECVMIEFFSTRS